MTCLVLTNGWSQDSFGEIRRVLDHSIGKVVRVPTEGRGEFHIADQELIIMSAGYGFSEHFSMWGHALALPYVIASFGSVNQNFTIGVSAEYWNGPGDRQWSVSFLQSHSA